MLLTKQCLASIDYHSRIITIAYYYCLFFVVAVLLHAKLDILKNLGAKTVLSTFDTFFHDVREISIANIVFQKSLCVQQNKAINMYFEQLGVSKSWQNFQIWVEYPFKV